MLRGVSPRAIPLSCYGEGLFLDFDSFEEIAKGFSFPTVTQLIITSLLSLSKCEGKGKKFEIVNYCLLFANKIDIYLIFMQIMRKI